MTASAIVLGQTATGKPFALPLDLATESMAIIARKGMGKTHTGRVIAEDLVDHHVPLVVFDPLDVWWGLRSNRAGDGPGLAVVIFGGSHADLPLHETAGKVIADVVVGRGLSAILVLDHLSQAGQRRFVADFMEQLFDRKAEQAHRTPIHLMIDEADAFAPQQPTPDGLRCLGAVDRAVRRGRSRGIGTTVITQRPASLSKNVLTQSEVLITLQVNSPQDRAALKLWIEANADGPQAKTFMDSLAGMQKGDAWVWSPSKLALFERIKIRQTRTYDSSYTPKIGEQRPKAPTLKAVDLAVLREQLGAVVAEAEANEPAKLKARIRELERQLAAKPASPVVNVAAAIEDALSQRDRDWSIAVQDYRKLIADTPFLTVQFSAKLAHANGSNCKPQIADNKPSHFAPVAPKVIHRERVGAADEIGMSKCEHAILTALAQRHPKPSSNAQLSVLSGYSPTSGGFFGAMASLRVKAYMDGDGAANRITAAGLDAVGDVPEIPSGAERLHYWINNLGKAEGSILNAIARVWPDAVSKSELCRQTGYSSTSGGFFGALAKLRKLELIERGQLRASDELMGCA